MAAKVLYVDDENINLFLFQASFEDEFEIITASSGEEGLEILSEEEIEILISDMNMPSMNGIELIKKAKHLNPQLRCVILSGYQQNETIQQAQKDGLVEAFVSKPFVKEKIIELINSLKQ